MHGRAWLATRDRLIDRLVSEESRSRAVDFAIPAASNSLGFLLMEAAMGIFGKLQWDSAAQVDDWLRKQLGGNYAKSTVSEKEFPAYRFVDLYRAIEAISAKHSGLSVLDSEAQEDLSSLIHKDKPNWGYRKTSPSTTTGWTVAPDAELFLPTDRFWKFDYAIEANTFPTVVRLKYNKYEENTLLEIGSCSSDAPATLVKEISNASTETSIYREQILALNFESGTKDEYGDIEKQERLRINFRTASVVSADDFVVDKNSFAMLKRNVIDLHTNRERLRNLGVPIKRGVLLYGPPGTGKTYACRYICGCLPGATRIVVAGTALNKVSQIFDLARLYQPSIVILEDVDLVFSARDINLYSSALGDLLDQMDGLRPFEDIGIVLTTNSIDRIEAAIKDRPGRISQCIYFGPPEKRLREKYIEKYSKNYDCTSADMEELLSMSEGATPAFIKEWIFRSVQFASERSTDVELALETADFREAYNEMRKDGNEISGSIIGFVAS